MNAVQDDFTVRYELYRQAVEESLAGLFTDKPAWMDLYESIRYSLLGGGKRIRPVLTLEFARLTGLDWSLAVPVGCALELVHTYSLIHDDLPCMDDDDMRRGRASNHKVYGETLAVLAGDALQPEAFRLILTAPGLSDTARVECARILAHAAGADGMVAGQVLDTLHNPETSAELSQVHRLKTGAMIAGACELGIAAALPDASAAQIPGAPHENIAGGAAGLRENITGGAAGPRGDIAGESAGPRGDIAGLREAARTYGYALGMAFQIRDDVLDVTADAVELGKPIGSDRQQGKVTFVDLYGVEKCGHMVEDFTRQACDAVETFDRDGFLRRLAADLAGRMK